MSSHLMFKVHLTQKMDLFENFIVQVTKAMFEKKKKLSVFHLAFLLSNWEISAGNKKKIVFSTV